MPPIDPPEKTKAKPPGLTFKQIQDIIKSHKKAAQRVFPRWDTWRANYQSRWAGESEGPQGSSDDVSDDDFIETNHTYAFVDTMVANVVPLNPAITINASNPEDEDFAKARQALTNATFNQQELYEKLWELATKASVYPRCFFKTAWNHDTGVPNYRVIDPRFGFFDQGAATWADIRYFVEVTVVPKSEFDMLIKGMDEERPDEGYDPDVAALAKFEGYPMWLRDRRRRRSLADEQADDVFKWVTIYEVHDFTVPGGRMLHVMDNTEKPLLDGPRPYKFLPNPYQRLVFTENLDDLGGLSDSQLVESLVNQGNELDVLDMNIIKTNMPMAFIHTGVCDNPSAVMEAYKNAGEPGAMAEVSADPGVTIDDVIKFAPQAQTSPSHMRMEGRIDDKIMFVLGMPAYSRGGIGGSDVATEYALADQATRTRNGRRQKAIYAVIGGAAEATVALYEEYMDSATVLYARVTGNEEMLEISRSEMGLAALKAENDEGILDFDYEAVPFSAMENNSLVQMKNITQLWPFIQFGIEQGMVDASVIMKRLLDVVHMGDAVKKPEGAMPGGPVPPLGGQGNGNAAAVGGGQPGAGGVGGVDTSGNMIAGGPGDGSGGVLG